MASTASAEEFWELETRAVLAVPPEVRVVATGGSVVHSPDAVRHMRSDPRATAVVWLGERGGCSDEDLIARGVVGETRTTVEGLWKIRRPLYESCHDFRVDTERMGISRCVDVLRALLGEWGELS